MIVQKYDYKLLEKTKETVLKFYKRTASFLNSINGWIQLCKCKINRYTI